MVINISQILSQCGYEHESINLIIYRSQKNQIAVVETNKGKKFVKIKKKGEGINEYFGTLLFKDLAPIIPTEKLIITQHIELVIQPFVATAEEDLLFHRICELEFEDIPESWNLIQSIFLNSLKLSTSTMHNSKGSAKNDDFFINRLKTLAKDGVSGRIENIYKSKLFKLLDVEIIWEELKTKKWCIDGVSYQETLEELLANASANHISNPLRLIGISHGNWHENNIIVTKNSDRYAYFALEFAGQNDLINDAIMFLTHTTIYADYLNPVYYSNAYGNSKIEEEFLKTTVSLKKRAITIQLNGDRMEVNGVGCFGTLQSRIKVAQLFRECYFQPLVKHALELFGQEI